MPVTPAQVIPDGWLRFPGTHPFPALSETQHFTGSSLTNDVSTLLFHSQERISRARIIPPHSRDGWQLPPRRMSRSSWQTGVRSRSLPAAGLGGMSAPLPSDARGRELPTVGAGRCPRGNRRQDAPSPRHSQQRERGFRGARVLHGQCPAKDGKGSPVAAGRERMRVPRVPAPCRPRGAGPVQEKGQRCSYLSARRG